MNAQLGSLTIKEKIKLLIGTKQKICPAGIVKIPIPKETETTLATHQFEWDMIINRTIKYRPKKSKTLLNAIQSHLNTSESKARQILHLLEQRQIIKIIGSKVRYVDDSMPSKERERGRHEGRHLHASSLA